MLRRKTGLKTTPAKTGWREVLAGLAPGCRPRAGRWEEQPVGGNLPTPEDI